MGTACHHSEGWTLLLLSFLLPTATSAGFTEVPGDLSPSPLPPNQQRTVCFCWVTNCARVSTKGQDEDAAMVRNQQSSHQQCNYTSCGVGFPLGQVAVGELFGWRPHFKSLFKSFTKPLTPSEVKLPQDKGFKNTTDTCKGKYPTCDRIADNPSIHISLVKLEYIKLYKELSKL